MPHIAPHTCLQNQQLQILGAKSGHIIALMAALTVSGIIHD